MTDELADLAADAHALRVIKKPDPVRTEFARADGVCDTLEGAVHFRTGDAILTGVRGERWPVAREQFLASYAPVPPTRAGDDGSYRKAPSIAYAVRLDRLREVPAGSLHDPLHGHPGDWLVQHADGTYGVVQDGIFRETYAPATGERRWPPG